MATRHEEHEQTDPGPLPEELMRRVTQIQLRTHRMVNDVLAEEILEDLRAATEQLEEILADLAPEESVEVEIAFAEAGLGFGGIAHAVVDSDAVDKSYELSGGTLRVVNQGRQAFTVFLLGAVGDGGNGREISVVVSSEGARIYAGTLRGLLLIFD